MEEYLADIDREGVGWKQVKNIDLYELKDGKTRSRIDKEINVNRWYQ